jgi:hypothetical protein
LLIHFSHAFDGAPVWQSFHADLRIGLLLLYHAVLLVSGLRWYYLPLARFEVARCSFQEVLFGFQGAMLCFCRLKPGRICVHLWLKTNFKTLSQRQVLG